MSEQQPAAQNPYLTLAVNFFTNPWVMAGLGGAAGYYFFGRKDGKTISGKTPYVAAGVGAAAGLAAGKIIQSMRMKQAALPAAAQAAQVQQHAQAQAEAEVAAQDGYYNMDSVDDVDQAFGQQPMAQQPGQEVEQEEVLQHDLEHPMGLGSLEGTSLGGGLGSFAREDGFDAYDSSIDEAIEDANPNRRN